MSMLGAWSPEECAGCGGTCRCSCEATALPCGCCEGVSVRTPRPVANRAGLAALRYRVGTYDDFLSTMLARLSSSKLPALRSLRTREPSDWTIAFLDAWAVAADVLTFYQERIANEGYLGTATERRSVLELARLVGYELRPGVAAATQLAFTLDPGHEVVVPAGTRVRSVPGPGEAPQTFETTGPLTARATLNRPGLRLARPQLVTNATDPLYLAGVNLGVKPADGLLLRTAAATIPVLRLVAGVEEDRDHDRTKVSFLTPPKPPPSGTAVSLASLVQALAGESVLSSVVVLVEGGTGTPPSPAFPRSGDAGDAHLRTLGTLRPDLAAVLTSAWASAEATNAQTTQVWALRVRAPLFGHNAPLELQSIANGIPEFGEWPVFATVINGGGSAQEVKDTVDLDAPYEKVAAGDWAVVDYSGVPDGHRLLPTDTNGQPLGPGRPLVTTVREVIPSVSRQDYGMAATITRLVLDDDWIDTTPSGDQLGPDFDIIRGTVVYTLSQEMTLATEPVLDEVGGEVLEFDNLYEGLEAGRILVLTGERADVPKTSGIMATEVLEVAAVAHATATAPSATRPGDQVHTWVQLSRALRHSYVRKSVVVHGNVSHATHGESRAEVLGSGDGSKPLQRFALRKPPLTFISAPTPSGLASTLDVRVNDLRWPEVANLTELGPATRGYVAQADEAALTTVVFGDGQHGARLPTGAENVRARYRDGIGKAANVAAGTISLLATKPLGVKEVVNPVAATGGADPDRLEHARRNAPLPLRALERLVSVSDYADFTRTFAGIGKASASRLLDRRRQVVFVTVAGVDDITLDEDSDVVRNLRLALRRWGDPDVYVAVHAREVLLAHVGLHVTIDPVHDPDVVTAALRRRLGDTLGFDARSLGQDLTESEVLHAVHQVAGVAWGRLERIEAVRYAAGGVEVVKPLQPLEANEPYHPGRRVVALEARTEAGGARPAQLLYLDGRVPETLELVVVTP